MSADKDTVHGQMSSGQDPPAYHETKDGPTPGYPQHNYPSQAYPGAGYPQQGYQAPPAYFQPGPQQGYPAYTTAPGTVPGPVHVIVGQPPLANAPQDNMAYSLIATFCCCFPIGIFAVMRAMEARKAIQRGDAVAAKQNSDRARYLANWSFGVGAIFTVLWIGIVIFANVYFRLAWQHY